jgi:predicted protein tyrosine phosphatase
MKFLCVCEMGSVRSGAMALALKNYGASDTLQCGWRSGSPETLRMLTTWADAIVVMQPEMIDLLTEKIGAFDYDKILVIDVGPDIYGHPMHATLIQYLWPIVEDWKLKEWRLVSATGKALPLVRP